MNQVDGRNLTEVQRIIEQTVNKEIWASKVSPKMQLFIWKIIHGVTPLGENLAKRGMLNNISCRHCDELETADHLFLHCNFTRQVWAANMWKQDFNPSDCSSFTTALLASSRLTTLSPLGVTETLFQWVCWGIWTARNYCIFENRIFSPAEILSKAIFCAREWIVAQPRAQPSHSAQTASALRPPQATTETTCYTDAAWSQATNRAGRQSVPVHLIATYGRSNRHPVGSPPCSRSWNFRNLHQVRLSGTHCCPILEASSADLYGITRDIETLSLRFTRISFCFILRSLNSFADSLAKSVMHSSFPN
ncbi:uncharacterized protein LOC106377849 [Brassica napus]|uniref:uncharacterized protein LOC106377849 n=1 Tax=Brassica napus TaxID=3708 RepID=UPI0006AAB182|nr:uncharacterized protein LOC106377849 [Brassica napus]